jgi:transcription termination factor NusB
VATEETSSPSAPEPEIKSANQRGAARLAAVQALYQMDIGGAGVLEIVAEYEAHRLGQRNRWRAVPSGRCGLVSCRRIRRGR